MDKLHHLSDITKSTRPSTALVMRWSAKKNHNLSHSARTRVAEVLRHVRSCAAASNHHRFMSDAECRRLRAPRHRRGAVTASVSAGDLRASSLRRRRDPPCPSTALVNPASPAIAPIGKDERTTSAKSARPTALDRARGLQRQDRHEDSARKSNVRKSSSGSFTSISAATSRRSPQKPWALPMRTGRGIGVSIYICNTPVRDSPQVAFSGTIFNAISSHYHVSCGAMIASTQPRAAP